jgi:putative tRNA adenosine deaminase-associated protein
MTDSGSDDIAVIVYREDDAWDVDLLPTALTEDLAGLIHALRQQPSIGGTIGLAAVGDDFFVAIRVTGGQASVFLSDLTAAVDWPLARQVLDHLELAIPDDEELDQVLPAGDLSIFADLGLDEMDLGMVAGNLDLFPDEALGIVARKLGFGQPLERALGLALGPVP